MNSTMNEEQYRQLKHCNDNNIDHVRNIKDNYREQVKYNTKYELYIYISKNRDDPDYNEWETRYKEKVHIHNSKILKNETDLDSGFDLFMPKNGAEYGSGEDILVTKPMKESSGIAVGVNEARALNMQVRCSMRENRVEPISMPISSLPENDGLPIFLPLDMITLPRLSKLARGYYLYPRSSISKTRMRIANSVGIIDSGYRGDIIAAVDTIGVFGSTDIWHIWKETLAPIKKYDRYFQICSPDLSPFMVYIVDNERELGKPTTRGAGCFGSTGV